MCHCREKSHCTSYSLLHSQPTAHFTAHCVHGNELLGICLEDFFHCTTVAKNIETAEYHDVDRSLFDRMISRSIMNDQRPTHSHWMRFLPGVHDRAHRTTVFFVRYDSRLSDSLNFFLARVILCRIQTKSSLSCKFCTVSLCFEEWLTLVARLDVLSLGNVFIRGVLTKTGCVHVLFYFFLRKLFYACWKEKKNEEWCHCWYFLLQCCRIYFIPFEVWVTAWKALVLSTPRTASKYLQTQLVLGSRWSMHVLPWPKKSLQPRYSWDWSAVRSCDNELRFDNDNWHRHDQRCLRVESSRCRSKLMSHDITWSHCGSISWISRL